MQDWEWSRRGEGKVLVIWGVETRDWLDWRVLVGFGYSKMNISEGSRRSVRLAALLTVAKNSFRADEWNFPRKSMTDLSA